MKIQKRPGAYFQRTQEKVSTVTEVAPITWGAISSENVTGIVDNKIYEIKSFTHFKDTFKLTEQQLATSKIAKAVYFFYQLNSGSMFIVNKKKTGDTDLTKAQLEEALDVLCQEEVTVVSAYAGTGADLIELADKFEKDYDIKFVPIVGEAVDLEDFEAEEIGDDLDDTLIFHKNTDGVPYYRGGMYFPTVQVINPFTQLLETGVDPAILMPSVYGYMITKHGIQRAPAGVEAVLPNVVDVDVHLTAKEQAVLNSYRVNCIVPKRNYGVVSWGNRMCGIDGDREYISDLLLDDYIDRWIKADTETFTFIDADKGMYTDITARISAFLKDLWEKGILAGDTINEAFVVRCDEDLNAELGAEKGEVIVEVGWAKKYPAEFIYTYVKYMSK